MYNGYKIVVVTPSGRSRYQKILFEYLKRYTNIIDEYRLWVNTTNKEDLAWFNEISQNYDWVKLDIIDNLPRIGTIHAIHKFFKQCTDPQTIYIRLDDDIVYLDKDFFTNLLDFRLKYPEYFLICGNIINNAICSHIHQKIGALDNSIGMVGYDCMDRIGWLSGEFASFVHQNFIKSLSFENGITKYFFDQWLLNRHERFSINAICWFGTDMQSLNGDIGEEEEEDITINKPKILNKYNVVCGNALCVHFAFGPQRDFLDRQTNLNYIYEKLINTTDNIYQDIEIKNNKTYSKLNWNAFRYFNNKHINDVAVICGTGETLGSYKPINNYIHIGCNDVVFYDKLQFDYYFFNDWKWSHDNLKTRVITYEPKIEKFLGNFVDDGRAGCSIEIAVKANALWYDVEGPNWWTKGGGHKGTFQKYIDKYWIGDAGGSTIFVCLQFALFCGFQEINIVGCDIIGSKHFIPKPSKNLQYLLNSWKKFKKFLELEYPDVKINVINPIGLKGYFNDVYQN